MSAIRAIHGSGVFCRFKKGRIISPSLDGLYIYTQITKMGIFKSTILRAHINVKGHDIVFNNSWSLLPYKSKATLEVDGVERAMSTKMLHPNPNIPLFDLQDISPEIESLQVFFIGVLSVKACIVVNGEIVYRDGIDSLDKLQARFFEG